MAPKSPHHLLNTSWTSHRLSPLHYKTESDSDSLLSNTSTLNTYANRLRDHLTNSLLDAQGWRAQDDPSTAAGGLSAIGALQSCTWEAIPSLSFLNQSQDEDETSEGEPVGLLITLTYETTTYKAALLASPSSISNPRTQQTQQQQQQQAPKRGRGRPSLSSKTQVPASTHLPLLLTRFPKPLRESFVSFLCSNFDTYVSPLRVSSSGLCGVLEHYVQSLTSEEGGGGEGDTDAEDIIRELHITLSFAPPIAPLLKSLNLNVPRETVGKFLRNSNSSTSRGSALLTGLQEYIQKHLAMELGLPSSSSLQGAGASTQSVTGAEGNDIAASLAEGYVRVTKIACAGFVLTGEGRLKVVAKGEEGRDGGDARNRGAMRGGEALLRAVLERAGMGFGRGKEGEE